MRKDKSEGIIIHYYYNTVLLKVCFHAKLPKNLIVIPLNHSLAFPLLKYGGVFFICLVFFYKTVWLYWHNCLSGGGFSPLTNWWGENRFLSEHAFLGRLRWIQSGITEKSHRAELIFFLFGCLKVCCPIKVNCAAKYLVVSVEASSQSSS